MYMYLLLFLGRENVYMHKIETARNKKETKEAEGRSVGFSVYPTGSYAKNSIWEWSRNLGDEHTSKATKMKKNKSSCSSKGKNVKETKQENKNRTQHKTKHPPAWNLEDEPKGRDEKNTSNNKNINARFFLCFSLMIDLTLVCSSPQSPRREKEINTLYLSFECSFW